MPTFITPPPRLKTLADADIGSPLEGNSLLFTGGKWRNGSAPAGIAVADTPAEGYSLVFRGGAWHYAPGIVTVFSAWLSVATPLSFPGSLRIPFDHIATDPTGSWDAGSKLWSVPVDGLYMIEARVGLAAQVAGQAARLEVNIGSNSEYDVREGSQEIALRVPTVIRPLLQFDTVHVDVSGLAGLDPMNIGGSLSGAPAPTYLRISAL